MNIPDDFELVCPDCKKPVQEGATGFWCRCGSVYPKGKGYEEYRKKKVWEDNPAFRTATHEIAPLDYTKIKAGPAPKFQAVPWELKVVDLPMLISDEMALAMIANGEKLFRSKHGGYVCSEQDEKVLDEWYGVKKPVDRKPKAE